MGFIKVSLRMPYTPGLTPCQHSPTRCLQHNVPEAETSTSSCVLFGLTSEKLPLAKGEPSRKHSTGPQSVGGSVSFYEVLKQVSTTMNF